MARRFWGKEVAETRSFRTNDQWLTMLRESRYERRIQVKNEQNNSRERNGKQWRMTQRGRAGTVKLTLPRETRVKWSKFQAWQSLSQISICKFSFSFNDEGHSSSLKVRSLFDLYTFFSMRDFLSRCRDDLFVMNFIDAKFTSWCWIPCNGVNTLAI